jgi:putative addiction module component (TIGR02574 family)
MHLKMASLPRHAELMTIDIANLRDLPVADKLRIVTQLWDDIAASTDPVIVPPDVLREASRRSAELKADPSIALDDDELWRRVDG